MEKLFIVIPAYNESDNITACVNAWYPVVEAHNAGGESRLVIINDGSKDDTYQILLTLSIGRPLLQPLTKPNGGRGATVLFGYRYVISEGADFIFQTDSDVQTKPAEFEAIWEARNQYDAVIGNRVIRVDGRDRKFVEDTVCFLLRIIFGVKVQDANAPFRLMRSFLVAKYIDKLPKDFNIPNIMFTTYFVYHQEKVRFILITFKPRQDGVNSINIKKSIKIGWRAVWDLYKLKKSV